MPAARDVVVVILLDATRLADEVGELLDAMREAGLAAGFDADLADARGTLLGIAGDPEFRRAIGDATIQPAATRPEPGGYDPMAVYRAMGSYPGLFDTDDSIYCPCGTSWTVYYTPDADAGVIAGLAAHAARCKLARNPQP